MVHPGHTPEDTALQFERWRLAEWVMGSALDLDRMGRHTPCSAPAPPAPLERLMEGEPALEEGPTSEGGGSREPCALIRSGPRVQGRGLHGAGSRGPPRTPTSMPLCRASFTAVL